MYGFKSVTFYMIITKILHSTGEDTLDALKNSNRLNY